MQVLGDRDLMEHEVVGQLAKRNSATPDYLHVFVRLSNVASITLDNDPAQTLAFDITDASAHTTSPRSALTRSLATSTPIKAPGAEDRYVKFRRCC